MKQCGRRGELPGVPGHASRPVQHDELAGHRQHDSMDKQHRVTAIGDLLVERG